MGKSRSIDMVTESYIKVNPYLGGTIKNVTPSSKQNDK
jgi:hypothetical protein